MRPAMATLQGHKRTWRQSPKVLRMNVIDSTGGNAMTLVLRAVAARRSYRLPRIAFNSRSVALLPLERIFVSFLDSGIRFLFFIGPRRYWTLLRISGHSQKRNYHGGDGKFFHATIIFLAG